MELEKFTYDNKLTKMFLFATVLWGVVGMLVGLTIAFELIFPGLSQNISWLSFGRLRPLHTNAGVHLHLLRPGTCARCFAQIRKSRFCIRSKP